MIPVNQWDNSYIVPPLFPAPRSYVRVFAFHNDSNVSVTAKFDSSNFTLNQGEFRQISSHAQPVVISSNKGVSVALYGASAGESDGHKSNPFMLVVPSVRQFSSTAAFFPTLQYGEELKEEHRYDNYVAIVLKKQFIDLLRYEGSVLQILQNYTLSVALTEYAIVITQLKNTTSHFISMINASTLNSMAVFVYGMAWYESYGFVAGFKFVYTECNALVPPVNGSLSSEVVPHGSYVTVSCNYGFTLTGERTLVCSSGSLSANIGTCEADCNALVEPVNGSLSSTVVPHGSYVTVSCNYGFTLTGERTLVCSSGSLSANIGTCEADCNALVAPVNGLLSSTVVPHGSYVTVSCNYGFTLTGERTLACSSGSLSADIGTCEADCSGLVAPLFGLLSSNVISHGNYVAVSCDHGYTLSGDRILACSSGSLSGNIGTCEADCKDLLAPTHGSLSSSTISHGSQVKVFCNNGYILSGERTLFCFSGSLSEDIGTCEAEEGPTVKGSSSLTEILVGGVLGFIIAVLLGIITVLCVQRRRKAIKESSTRLKLEEVKETLAQAGDSNNEDISLANGRPDSSTYATLDTPEAPYLTPISSGNTFYDHIT